MSGGRRSNRRTKISGQFTPRPIEMLESPAYRALSLSAHRVFSRVEVELAHHGGADNGALPVTFDDFERYGIHRHAIKSAINECVELGFLEITVPGRSGNGEHRSPNLFRLTYRPTNRDAETNEWRRIETIEEAEGRAKLARSLSSKTKRQWQKTPDFSGGKRTESEVLPVVDSATTGLVRIPPLLSISRGGDTQKGDSPTREAQVDPHAPTDRARGVA